MKNDSAKSTTNHGADKHGSGKRLVGWLVSYQNNERGSYYEIRSGKTFIGSGIVEGQRLISLDSKSFATPHAVVKASSDQPLVVQDIFSDSGTFVRRTGTGEEIPVNGPTEVTHGDWIRFGDTLLFQVCLIHGGSR